MDFLIPSFSDIFDIIIISFLLYGLLVFMKKTTGIELFSLLVLVLLLYFLAIIFNWNMILSLMRGLQSYWILAIIIIYHGEIKSLLSDLSKSKNILALFKNPIKMTFNPILDAITVFSETKTGALLVFEKNQKLDNFIATGDVIDAKISSKLLLSIFNRSTILHDGAVIIRGDRLYAAKVVLPLTQNEDFGKSFGTRHLAAIGITEVSDAFCLVVSEQTGRISFTKDQNIYLDLSIEEIFQMLTDEAKQ
ncbi:MAG: diadenylate cyclase CdaA [Candidatus Cloacimonetes bacterium]|nr:diadenylate cyclase CdaA [Candidatus Cloacimonadota bacterium]